MADDIPYHPIANCWPLMEGEAFDALVADIRQHGLHHPIKQFEEMILDGRNRDRACRKAGVEPRYETFTGTYEEAVAYAVSANNQRRHLSREERAFVGVKLSELSGVGRPGAEAVVSQDSAATLMDVSVDSIQRAKAITKAPPEVRPQIEQAVKDKKISLATGAKVAKDLVKLTPENRRALVKEVLERPKRPPSEEKVVPLPAPKKTEVPLDGVIFVRGSCERIIEQFKKYGVEALAAALDDNSRGFHRKAYSQAIELLTELSEAIDEEERKCRART